MKFFLLILIIPLVLHSCVTLMECKKDRTIYKESYYQPINLRVLDTLQISMEKIKDNKFSIKYQLLYPLDIKGASKKDLCNLGVIKEYQREKLIIEITPVFKVVGKNGISRMGEIEMIRIIKDTKEKIPKEIRQIEFSYRGEKQRINLKESY